MFSRLPNHFDGGREELIDFVAGISNLSGDTAVSDEQGGLHAARHKLLQLAPKQYKLDRNYLDGHVSNLSPYLRHGVLSAATVKEQALQNAKAVEAGRFLQQLAWREYFHLYLDSNPHVAWKNIESYKTGWCEQDYLTSLPPDISIGRTGVRIIDQMIKQLLHQGLLHNHARLYLAAYVVHWRRVNWKCGAQWFLCHLLDGDIASNNLSWQWVASTFSAKPYFFNLENVVKFSRGSLDCEHESNAIFAKSYDELREELFPLADKRIWQ